MDFKLTVEFEKGELDEVEEVVSAIKDTVTVPIEQLDITPTQKAVLRAVRDDPGRAARKIHEKAASYDESPIDWVDRNSPEREAVKKALDELRGEGLVQLDERSWYPAD